MVHRGLCRERQKRCYSRKKANVHNKETTLALFVFCNEMCFEGREDKETMKTREWSNLNFFPKLPFSRICRKKNSTHSILGARSFLLLVHIRFTPSEGPEDSVKFNL
jgi:hypothetical protein